MTTPQGICLHWWGRRFRLPTGFLLLLLATPAAAQFDLQVVDPTGTRPAPALYDVGSVYGNETGTARFRLRNVTTTPATASTLAVAGMGFSLTGPTLPVTLDPQASVEFNVSFRATDLGSYSAVLRAENITILLTATVQPRLTYRVDDAPLVAAVDFGPVIRGSSSRRRFTLINETALILIVPAISVQSGDFAIVRPSPSGTALRPTQAAEFLIDFAPSAAGPRQGTLTLGDRSYSLTGLGSEPSLPKPLLSIDLRQAASAQQGTLVIAFDKPATTSGTGAATLDFRGPADSTVAFASGARTVSFPVTPGDTGVAMPFQTGTTAGTLVFSVSLGSASDQASIQIPRTAPALGLAQGLRSANSIEARVTGYDNTRTVSQLSFTFYDLAGNAIAPGAISVDASGEFARFFAGSELGGVFLFRGVFPVTGDVSQVASFEVAVTDAVGITKSARTAFQ
jgi:hypothetical protein